jgi:hypothetical protein
VSQLCLSVGSDMTACSLPFPDDVDFLDHSGHRGKAADLRHFSEDYGETATDWKG